MSKKIPEPDSLEWRYMFSEVFSYWSCGWQKQHIAKEMGYSNKQMTKIFKTQAEISEEERLKFKEACINNTIEMNLHEERSKARRVKRDIAARLSARSSHNDD